MRYALSAMIVLGLLLTGCAGPGFLAEVVTGGKKFDRRYELPDRATLVLVDDPRSALDGFALPGVVASNVNYHLDQNRKKALPKGRLIPADAVHELQDRLGASQFESTPVDQVGRLLGAEQVIHVTIEEAAVNHAAQMYRPRALVSVRVIDVAESRRLWPNAQKKLVDSSQTPQPHRLTVEMSYRGTDFGGGGLESMLAKQLAEQIGLEVAQLFYDYRPPPAGHTIR